jgi:hypothetical protein
LFVLLLFVELTQEQTREETDGYTIFARSNAAGAPPPAGG